MVRRLLWVICAGWACLGMVCTGEDGLDPALPEIKLRKIGLRIVNEENGKAGASLAWEWPSGEKVSHFEIYQSLRKDSLGSPVGWVQADSRDSVTALVQIPDSTRPMTVYYGVRAVLIEPTGQRLYGRTIPVDSLVVNPSLTILSPGTLSYRTGRILDVEVSTSSDDGIVLRQTLYEKSGGDWRQLLDTCLPMAACNIPYFSSKTHSDALVLQTPGAKDTLESLYCVLGDESFEDLSTGRRQSLGCIRFFRTGSP